MHFGFSSFLSDGYFSPMALYGALLIVIMFMGYFLTSTVFHGQDSALIILSCLFRTGLIMRQNKPTAFCKANGGFGIGALFFIINIYTVCRIEAA